METERDAVWAEISSSHFPEANGTGIAWSPLRKLAVIFRWHHYHRTRFSNSSTAIRGSASNLETSRSETDTDQVWTPTEIGEILGPCGELGKTLAPLEKNYCVTRKEFLAVVKAVKPFRPYLYVQKFWLGWLCLRKEPSNQVARWPQIRAEFTYVLEHRAGMKHGKADGLSRHNRGECRQHSLIESRDGGPSRIEM